jgi:hypothetical protein
MATGDGARMTLELSESDVANPRSIRAVFFRVSPHPKS